MYVKQRTEVFGKKKYNNLDIVLCSDKVTSR